jgi:hypothetical protein
MGLGLEKMQRATNDPLTPSISKYLLSGIYQGQNRVVATNIKVEDVDPARLAMTNA